jgi:hypothetical protein
MPSAPRSAARASPNGREVLSGEPNLAAGNPEVGSVSGQSDDRRRRPRGRAGRPEMRGDQSAFRRTQPRMDPTGGRDARYLDKPIHDPLSVTTLTPVAQRDHSKKLQPINPYRGRKCSRGQSGFHSRNPNLASTIAPPLDEAPNSNSPPSAFTRSRMPDSPIPALVSPLCRDHPPDFRYLSERRAAAFDSGL